MTRGTLFRCFLTVALLGSGCAPRTLHRSMDALPDVQGKRIVIRTEAEVYRVEAGGVADLQVERSDRVRESFAAALAEAMTGKGFVPVPYEEPAPESDRAHRLEQLLVVHRAVFGAASRAAQLPTTRDRFNWNLGPGVAQMRDGFEADYALFAEFFERELTTGRKFVEAMAGVRTEGCFGVVSLVDLRSGDLL